MGVGCCITCGLSYVLCWCVCSKEGAGKIGGVEFDSEVYRQALADNAANRSAQKARNWGSANLLANHPATPQGQPGLDDLAQDDLQHPGY